MHLVLPKLVTSARLIILGKGHFITKIAAAECSDFVCLPAQQIV
jgi:hypothetical protein